MLWYHDDLDAAARMAAHPLLNLFCAVKINNPKSVFHIFIVVIIIIE
jgi:hypothetical protein